MVSVVQVEPVVYLSPSSKRKNSVGELDRVVIVVDKAERPLFSATEASWSEVPPLCRHAPTHARNLKRITTVCRWEGAASERRSWIKAPMSLGRNASLDLSYESGKMKKVQTRVKCLPMPTRKASMDMANCTLRKPMRKASMEMITAEMAQICKDVMRKPMRKASMEMGNVEDRAPRRQSVRQSTNESSTCSRIEI